MSTFNKIGTVKMYPIVNCRKSLIKISIIRYFKINPYVFFSTDYELLNYSIPSTFQAKKNFLSKLKNFITYNMNWMNFRQI